MAKDEGFEWNLKARELEAKGDIDKAILFYERALQANFDGNGPYDRLSILYRKRKQYKDEIRVLTHAIYVFETFVSDERSDKYPKLERFKVRLQKVKDLENV
ncbi:hypothetical protein [Paenibacillus ehimensis]|uniref:hypothetical protein n=1 Tax=Paenibacillus ehimensis TaxID=79264 RepID=UPI000FDA2D3C|nr:hypothetical protein [Paenibacillus ehimensis]